MAPQLSPPGSSSYTSSSMHVGDGTWDSSRDTLLLPNLVGLNFDTMRYNGMGNRFKDLPQYHNIVRGHAVIAVITFLFIVPSAIMIARFHRRNPYWAMRIHIWLQIITVFLSTVVLVLGWFAVGPKRSLTNPHHGIGVAIYVLILAQAIGGRFVYWREKGKNRATVPLKVMLHQWSGRFIALLGIAQIPLGLTLYGSPLVLFILYTLAVFILFLAYFILSYRDAHRVGRGRGSSESYSGYGSGTEVISEHEGRRHSRFGTLAGLGAGAAGLAALNKFRHRSRSRSRSRPDVVGSRPPSGSYIENEKLSRRDHEGGGGFKDKLFKVAAVAGAAGLARKFMHRDDDRDQPHYNAGLGGAHSISQSSLSRVEGGRRSNRLQRPQPLHRRSQSFDSEYSSSDYTGDSPIRPHNIRNKMATLGAMGALRSAFKGRRDRKEDRRIEEMRRRDIEDERLARQGSQKNKYTGDGFPRHGGRRGSLTSTDLTRTDDMTPGTRQQQGIPGPPPPGTVPGQMPMPTAPPAFPRGTLDESGSEMYDSAGGRRHRGHRSGRNATAAGGAAAAVSGIAGASTGGVQQHQSGESVASPPLSVKVRMHNDGRHVTLRKLSEQEAAAERAARRRERGSRSGSRRRHRRNDSESDLSGVGASDHWRRVEDRERLQAQQAATAGGAAPSVLPAIPGGPGSTVGQAGYPPPPPIPQTTMAQAGYPPPPPIPAAGAMASSVGSPGTATTEASGDHALRRQRRRAERAANRRPTDTVDFE